MNILMMSNTYYPITGGLEKSIDLFSREFRRRGHKVLIVAPEFKGSKKLPGVVRIPAIQNFNGTDFSVSLPVPAIVSKIVHAFKPEIVHAHHPFLMGDMAMRLAKQYGIPLIFTHHTMFEQYTDYFPLNTEAGKNFVMELTTGFANLADHVIAPSESVREILMERGVRTPIWVIPTGVVMSQFKKGDGAKMRRKLKIPAKAFVTGYAGRISAEKNLAFHARAVSGFLKKNKNAFFIVVGDGPFMPEMKKIFEETEVTRQVRFAGILKGKKLTDAYHAMDVFSFASESETQGMVVTEAMAAGIPVLAIDAPGVREVVRDRKNGRLLKTEDIREFAKALDWFSRLSAVQKKKLKTEALKTAEAFSIENSAMKMLRLYEKKSQAREDAEDESLWSSVMRRIKTEWDMLSNLGKAAGNTIAEAVKTQDIPAHSELVTAGSEKKQQTN
jgi:1,2-diacylglycerol 3-alpha-glucosyltransferase